MHTFAEEKAGVYNDIHKAYMGGKESWWFLFISVYVTYFLNYTCIMFILEYILALKSGWQVIRVSYIF